MIWIPLYLAITAGTIPAKQHVTGRLSVYKPNDGWNSGYMACGGKLYRKESRHIAVRRWSRRCNAPVIIYATATRRWAIATVQDAGPFGIYKPPLFPLKRLKPEGRWKVWTKGSPPPGWQWRGVADLSLQTWIDLGKPRFLSKIHLWFLKRNKPLPKRVKKLLTVASH
jgi:hypothetical protein